MPGKKAVSVLWVVLFSFGCDSSSGNDATGSSVTVFDYFQQSGQIALEETEGDLIGQIGTFFETENGGLLVGDAILPRVRLFDAEGHILASFGQSGEGPFEFRNIRGLAQNPRGETLVVDARLGRMTVLTADLQPEKIHQPRPVPRGEILRMGDGMLLVTSPGERSIGISKVTDDGTGLWNVTPPTFSRIMEVPYWGGAATMPVAASTDLLAAAFSFLYPIYLYDGRGILVDSLANEPRSFRQAPELEPGALYGAESDLRLSEWLSSFDVIADLAVIADSLLVVTHGDLVSNSADMFDEVHRRVDVYHLPSLEKLAEDVSLPPGSRVLGGGKALYLLISEPPEPWTIVRLVPR